MFLRRNPDECIDWFDKFGKIRQNPSQCIKIGKAFGQCIKRGTGIRGNKLVIEIGVLTYDDVGYGFMTFSPLSDFFEKLFLKRFFEGHADARLFFTIAVNDYACGSLLRQRLITTAADILGRRIHSGYVNTCLRYKKLKGLGKMLGFWHCFSIVFGSPYVCSNYQFVWTIEIFWFLVSIVMVNVTKCTLGTVRVLLGAKISTQSKKL